MNPAPAIRRVKTFALVVGPLAAILVIAGLFFQGRMVRAWKQQTIKSQIVGSGIELSDSVPTIEGTVRALNRASGLAILALTGDQRAREGDRLVIHRDGRLVAIVKVIRLEKGLAGTRIIFTADRESILVGDQASTRP